MTPTKNCFQSSWLCLSVPNFGTIKGAKKGEMTVPLAPNASDASLFKIYKDYQLLVSGYLCYLVFFFEPGQDL